MKKNLYIRVVPTWGRRYESNGIFYPWGMQSARIPRDEGIIEAERQSALESALRNAANRSVS